MGSHRAATKAASTKYAGYVGGAAVALGVGAAIAVAGQGTAHADTDSGSAKTSSKESSTAGSASRGSSGVNAGPKADTKSGTKADTKTGSKTAGKTERPRPLSKVSAGVQKAADKAGKDIKKAVDTAAARAEKAAARTEKVGAHVSGQINSQINKAAATVSKSVTDSLKPVTGTVKPVTKDALKDFEAEQIARLKQVFTPKEAAAPNPKPEGDSALEKTTPTVRATADTRADTQVDAQADAPADPPWSPNPLRPDDPDPTDFPDAIMDLRDALLGASPDFLDPLVREATEQIYRGSQIVPWVNAVIPISKILPNLAPALGDDDAARDARQLIITELIKTTPPGSALYYGYDIIADLINLESPAAELKYGAVATVWNILDPLQLVHNKDKAVGIGSAAG